MRYNIHFNSVDDIKNFVAEIEKFHCDVNVYDNSRCLDGKSVMALINLDLNKDFVMELVTDNVDVICQIEKKVERWIVELS